MKKGLFLFADYYDATSSAIRVLRASKGLFDDVEFLYWARTGKERDNADPLYEEVRFEAFKKTAKPRSLGVLFLFFSFQYWIFKSLLQRKPTFVVSFTFFTILPSLLYKYFFNWRCKVIYDPRDYVSESFRMNAIIAGTLNFVDNIFIKLSNFVIFPDRQYFIYYGRFSLKENKYLIIPNSTEDVLEIVEKIDIRAKYNLPKEMYLIPILGYFSETRGEKILFELIERKIPNLYFVFAGDIRDEKYLTFFDKNANNVTYLGKIPYLDALAIMKNSLLVPQLYDPILKNNIYGFATKYYDCLMVGTPIITSIGMIEMSNEIESNNFGWAVGYEDTDELQRIIQVYIQNPNIIEKVKLRKYFLQKYNYTIYVKKLREVYSRFSQ
ncbi:hypothetical protein PFY12_05450 [Chryseobacterium camelliae]|uniref:Glycosyl transferase family 1 domain-containing protein n=1 Tax=Chryseobacterium camelliae TaxID=1265445 RepID=A0ABY7QPM7_9FLAO|nr:glycosyltransferase [Chryseobacterium camelliae]WBV61567.1 hypothetical protein PFY12_05450 [Chryseobacterium camelliae]